MFIFKRHLLDLVSLPIIDRSRNQNTWQCNYLAIDNYLSIYEYDNNNNNIIM